MVCTFYAKFKQTNKKRDKWRSLSVKKKEIRIKSIKIKQNRHQMQNISLYNSDILWKKGRRRKNGIHKRCC